ncbi:hypothetical protein [Luteipulveratus halotolerans]|nr:hypothetical protein [Luteipulveratus halotolerans]
MSARAWRTGERVSSRPWIVAAVGFTGLALAAWGRHALAELARVTVP